MNDFIKKILPWIGAAATSNIPALITLAAKEVGDALGVEVPAEPAAIATAVTNATPEQITRLKEMELGFQERMQAMGFGHAEEMQRLTIAEARLYTEDTADARQHNAGDAGVFRLGVVVLITFAAVMGACLYGAYQILTGGMVLKDVAVVAAVSGFLGSIVGYVASNAQQVISYFFGSSKGSADKTNAMADAVKGLGRKA